MIRQGLLIAFILGGLLYIGDKSYAGTLNDYNPYNVNIPDNSSQVNSDLSLSGAPSGAVITKVKIYYEIRHTYPRDLDIWLTSYYDGSWHDYYLYHSGDLGSSDDIVETRDNLHHWDGASPNQTWYLVVQDRVSGDVGYIDFFELWVYYSYNETPDTPSNEDPYDGQSNVTRTTDLDWSCSDPDGDTVYYTVYLEKNDSSPDNIIKNDSTGSYGDPGTLDYDSHYYWRVKADDHKGGVSWGPVWDFFTEPAPIIDAEVTDVSFNRYDVKRGQESVTATVTIRNTGDQSWTFYVGGSSIKEGDTTWYDWSPSRASKTLNPNESGSVQLSWSPDSSVPIGTYGFYSKIFKYSTGDDYFDEDWRDGAFEVVDFPSAPAGVIAQTGSGSGEIDLSWTASDGATGYVIVYDEDSSNPPWSPTQNGTPGTGSDVGNVIQVTVSGLTPGQKYYFAVAAYNASGLGDYSTVVSATAGDEPTVPVPNPPAVTSNTGSGSGEIDLSWTASDGATGYVIVYDEDSSNPPWSPTQNGTPGTGSDVGNVIQVTVSGLTPGQKYYFAVAAYNASGLGDYSTVVSATAGVDTDDAEIIQFSPPTGTLQRGSETQATARIKNTGTSTRSFWVGLSFAHSTATGDGWPVGWYNIQPIQTGILDPGDEEEVIFPVAIDETFRAGQYYAVSCVWDAFNEELYIMEGRIDSTLWHPMEHPEWVDNPDLGMLSFSLPQFNVPYAARTIMDEFETISWILENKGLRELYLEGKKPLLCLKVSVPIKIAGIPVDVGGAILIDLADLFELTPEGKEWTTIWIDSEVGGIAFGVNLDKPGNEVEFKPIDAAIIMHNFDYNERGIADFRDHVLEWFTGTTPEIGFGSVTVPGMCFTAAKYYDRDNIEGPSYDRCGTTKLGITVMNAINVLHKVEMRTQYVRMALLAWSLGQDLQENIVPIGEYVSHVNAILDSYPNSADVLRDFTYDDGDWPLQQGQPQTNLKMRLVNNDPYNSLHRFYIDVPEGASNLTFQSSDGTGDCRIYYSLNRRPNLATGDWDGRSPFNPNSTLQTCSIENPVVAGRYYIALHISSEEPYGYEGVRFVATYEYDVCMSIPTDCQSFTYSSATSPVLSADPSQAKPMGLGTVAEGGGTLSITVKTYQFSGPVDIYFGLYSPRIDPDNIYLLTSGGAFQKSSEGLAPWKANITGPIDESLFGDIQTSSLPEGTYYLYLLVTPTGNLSNYYLWITSFGSCNSLKFTPEGTTFSYDSIGRSLELGASEQITLITTAFGASVTVSSVTKTSGGTWLSASSGGGSKVILNLDVGASDVNVGSTYIGTVKVVAGGITDHLYVTLQVQEAGYQLPTPPPFPGFGDLSP